jgi:2-methylcitrate dehydratase PrpD
MTAATEGDLSRRWAVFASKLDYENLPSQLISVLKGLVLDTVGVALAASTLGDCCKELAALTRANAGSPECTVLGFGDRTSCLMAGFANGGLAHALNFDAMGSLGGHVGLAATPAPLALAERQGRVSGKEFLTAVAVAAEFTSRLARALKLKKVNTSEKFLEGQVLGYFGAALGAGRVLRFTPDQLHGAMGIALMQAAGTRQISLQGGPAKAIYGAFANHGAILSVLLTEQGIDGRCAALEGPAGLFGLFYGGRFDADSLTDRLGQEFVCEQLAFKPWATSSVVRPFIRACLELARAHRLDPSAIERVVLRVGPEVVTWLEPAADRRHPRSAATAANSIFFGIAKALANGDVTLEDFTAESLIADEAGGLAERIAYTVNQRAGSGSVENRTQGRIVDIDANRHRFQSYRF